ncbi:hypothetical protein V5799_014567 [Amblyomma americanum]|uniref:Uncharacterized protein n=1 Tax=Amblyomma americanum TaxID=6943 RepID=A0AAQ4E2M8_AMBAM
MDPIRLLQELEREANEKRRGTRAAANAADASVAPNKIANGPLLLLDDMAASNDKTPLLKETSALNGPTGTGRRKGQKKSLPPRKKPPSVKEKTGVGGGGRGGATLPVNKHPKSSNKSSKSAVKPVENSIPKVSFEDKKALTPVPEEQNKQDAPAQLEFKIREQPDLLVQEGDSKNAATVPVVPVPEVVSSVEPKPKEKTSVLSRMRDAAKKINVAPSKLQQTVMNAKILHNRLSLSKPNSQQDSSDPSLAESGSGQPQQESSTAAASMDLLFADSPDSMAEEEASTDAGEKKEGAAEDAAASKPPEQERPKGATWTGTTANAELALKILNMSRRGDWLGVDALLKHVEKGDLPADLADEVSMF